jgi:hypothetical protein
MPSFRLPSPWFSLQTTFKLTSGVKAILLSWNCFQNRRNSLKYCLNIGHSFFKPKGAQVWGFFLTHVKFLADKFWHLIFVYLRRNSPLNTSVLTLSKLPHNADWIAEFVAKLGSLQQCTVNKYREIWLGLSAKSYKTNSYLIRLKFRAFPHLLDSPSSSTTFHLIPSNMRKVVPNFFLSVCKVVSTPRKFWFYSHKGFVWATTGLHIEWNDKKALSFQWRSMPLFLIHEFGLW